MANDVCTPMDGKGKEIADFLIEKLAIPKDCRGFDLHVAAGEPITIDIHAYVREGNGTKEVSLLTSDTREYQMFVL